MGSLVTADLQAVHHTDMGQPDLQFFWAAFAALVGAVMLRDKRRLALWFRLNEADIEFAAFALLVIASVLITYCGFRVLTPYHP
jgi:hypothetical protein